MQLQAQYPSRPIVLIAFSIAGRIAAKVTQVVGAGTIPSGTWPQPLKVQAVPCSNYNNIMPKGIAARGIVYLVFASPHHRLDLGSALLHSYCQSQLHGGRCNFSGFFLLVDCWAGGGQLHCVDRTSCARHWLKMDGKLTQWEYLLVYC